MAGQDFSTDTSWEEVAVWYDSHLRSYADSYQAQVILPKLTKLLTLTGKETLLDLACGQGYFSHTLLPLCARVIGVDAAPSLVNFARSQIKEEFASRISFYTAPAHILSSVPIPPADRILIVLALQNIRELSGVFAECARLLEKNGSVHIVLNHPSFRVPKASNWRYDADRKMMMREVSRYLSEFSSAIVMNPGSKEEKKETTVSFHRPLSSYIQTAAHHGFVLSDLEEWASHKESQKGPRAAAENLARKEIPLFMYLKFEKYASALSA